MRTEKDMFVRKWERAKILRKRMSENLVKLVPKSKRKKYLMSFNNTIN